jgi:hypothetical protein
LARCKAKCRGSRCAHRRSGNSDVARLRAKGHHGRSRALFRPATDGPSRGGGYAMPRPSMAAQMAPTDRDLARKPRCAAV